MTADEKLRQAINNLKALHPQFVTHSYPEEHKCQRMNRLAWNGRDDGDPAWIHITPVPGVHAPRTDTALHGGQRMLNEHDPLGFDLIANSKIGEGEGKYQCYFTGAGGCGHVAIVIYSKVAGKLVGMMYDNIEPVNGHRMTQGWRDRLFCAVRPKDD
jgi:hypothetical protein